MGSLRKWGEAWTIGGLLVVLIVGMQLGGLQWRYRKQIWQLQGALAGAVIGFVVGRLCRPDDGASS